MKMIELLLSVVNLTFVIFFVVVFFKIAKIGRKHLSRFAFLTLIFGVFILFFNASPSKTVYDQEKTKANHDTDFTFIQLDKSLISHLELTVVYTTGHEDEIRDTRLDVLGVTLGAVAYKITSSQVSKAGNQIDYDIRGVKEYCFCGIKCYGKPFVYRGTHPLP